MIAIGASHLVLIRRPAVPALPQLLFVHSSEVSSCSSSSNLERIDNLCTIYEAGVHAN